MILLVIALMCGFLVAIPAAIRHDSDQPVSHTGKARK